MKADQSVDEDFADFAREVYPKVDPKSGQYDDMRCMWFSAVWAVTTRVKTALFEGGLERGMPLLEKVDLEVDRVCREYYQDAQAQAKPGLRLLDGKD